jgi:hypothetical protein
MNANPSRQIVGFMAFAMAFAIIGHTAKTGTVTTGSGASTGSALAKNITGQASDVKILVGGAIGTVLLVLLASAGDGAAKFAKGLAGVTLLSSVLINGTSVFGAVSHLTGTKTTAPTTTTTKVSAP